MGKRELILIATFAILGAVVYQFTAPPPGPGERSFSISKILDDVRREVRGNRSSAEHTATASQQVGPEVSEVRITQRNGPLVVVGEARDTVESELAVRSSGFDEAEAKKLAAATTVKFDRAGPILFIRIDFPEGGRQTARLSLKVPERLIVRTIEATSGKVDISGVASVEMGMARGDTTIRQVKELVSVAHRGGDVVITDAGSLKLTTRGSDARVEQVRGEAIFNTQSGDLKTSGLAGSIELESNSTDVELEALEKTNAMIRINSTGGSITLRGLRTESRIDLRNAELTVVMDRSAPVAIYSDGQEPVDLTFPASGFRLDAVTRDATLTTVPDALFAKLGLTVDRVGEDEENKVIGDVNGGGPLLTIRTRRGDLTLRSRESSTSTRR